MADGDREIGYVIAEALDIINMTEPVIPAKVPGPVAGVISVEGEQIEILDIHWLFACCSDGSAELTAEQPSCLFAGADLEWLNIFLRPVLNAAGYRLVASLSPGERPVAVLAMADEPVPPLVAAPVLRLRRGVNGDDDSIYRYDRAALLQALDARRMTGTN